jgi:hypothetical protein
MGDAQSCEITATLGSIDEEFTNFLLLPINRELDRMFESFSAANSAALRTA